MDHVAVAAEDSPVLTVPADDFFAQAGQNRHGHVLGEKLVPFRPFQRRVAGIAGNASHMEHRNEVGNSGKSLAGQKGLEEKLAVHNFFRCAKGYLVNMNHVEGFVGSDCVIHNVHIPVSRTRKKEFMNLLLQNLNME